MNAVPSVGAGSGHDVRQGPSAGRGWSPSRSVLLAVARQGGLFHGCADGLKESATVDVEVDPDHRLAHGPVVDADPALFPPQLVRYLLTNPLNDDLVLDE